MLNTERNRDFSKFLFGGIIYSCKMIGLRKRLEYAESTQFQREYIVVRVKCDSKVRKTDGNVSTSAKFRFERRESLDFAGFFKNFREKSEVT